MLDLLLKRRTCRQFKSQIIEDVKKEQLLNAALLAPTGRNTQSTEFILIEERSTLRELGKCRQPQQNFLPNAPLAIVVLASKDKTDTWVEDASVAASFIQLTAESLGLGSAWVQIHSRESNQDMSSGDFLRGLLSIPENMGVLCIIAVGYPEKNLPHRTLDKLNYDRIHHEEY